MHYYVFEKYGSNIPFGLRAILSRLTSVDRAYNFQNAQVKITYDINEANRAVDSGKIVLFVYNDMINFVDGRYTCKSRINWYDTDKSTFEEAYIISNAKNRMDIQKNRDALKKDKIFRMTELEPRKDIYWQSNDKIYDYKTHKTLDVDKSGYIIDPSKYQKKLRIYKAKNGNLYNDMVLLISRFNKMADKCIEQYKRILKLLIINKSNEAPYVTIENGLHNIRENIQSIVSLKQQLEDIINTPSETQEGDILEIYNSLDDVSIEYRKIEMELKNNERNIDQYYNINKDDVIYENRNTSVFDKVFEAVSMPVKLIDETEDFALYKGKITKKVVSELAGVSTYDIPQGISQYNYIIAEKNDPSGLYVIFSTDTSNGSLISNNKILSLDDYSKKDIIELIYKVVGEQIYNYEWIPVDILINYFGDDELIKNILYYRFSDFSSSKDKIEKDIKIFDYIDSNNLKDFILQNERYYDIWEKLSILPEDLFNKYVLDQDILESIYYNISSEQFEKIQNAISKYTGAEEMRVISYMESIGYKFTDRTILNSISNAKSSSDYRDIISIIDNHPNIASTIKKLVANKFRKKEKDRFIKDDIPLNITDLYKNLLFASSYDNDTLFKICDRIVNYKQKIPDDLKISIKNRLKSIDRIYKTNYYKEFENKQE